MPFEAILCFSLSLSLQEQSKLIWKYRDLLKNNLSKVNMHQLLEANDQKIPKGEASVSSGGW